MHKIGTKVKIAKCINTTMGHICQMDRHLGETVEIIDIQYNARYSAWNGPNGPYWLVCRCKNGDTVVLDKTEVEPIHGDKFPWDRFCAGEFSVDEIRQDYTAEEIERAKQLSRKLVVRLFDDGECSPVFYVDQEDNSVSLSLQFGYPHKRVNFISKPSGGDVFNADIGKCVCLCKATGTPMPEFIKNKNGEVKP